jgi:hypothetical protein
MWILGAAEIRPEQDYLVLQNKQNTASSASLRVREFGKSLSGSA